MSQIERAAAFLCKKPRFSKIWKNGATGFQ